MAFDDRNVRWAALGDFTQFVVTVCNVDVDRGIVDFLVKFDPHSRIHLHRHLSETNTFVVQGEHWLYDPDGSLRDVRPVGRYTSSPPGPPEREGAGDEPCVVFYSIRSDQDLILEFLNDDMTVYAPLTVQDVLAAWEEQKQAAAATPG